MTPLPNRTIASLLALAACCVFSSCKTTQKTGTDDVVDYTSPNTKMSHEEYPFDDNGNYREDWAARGAGVSGVKDKPTADTPYIQEPDEPSTPTVASHSSSSSGSSGVKKSGSSSSSRSTASRTSSSRSTASRSSSSKSKPKTASKPKPKPKPVAKSTYVKVKSGDSLYSISKKTGVPIATIKAANGLKSDVIVDGKTLKIPPKKR